MKGINKTLIKYINEPHEKILLNIISIIIFAVLYYVIYLNDKNCFIVNETVLLDRENQELTFMDILYYSILLNFTTTFGDIIPFSQSTKLLASLQSFIFWYIALFPNII